MFHAHQVDLKIICGIRGCKGHIPTLEVSLIMFILYMVKMIVKLSP